MRIRSVVVKGLFNEYDYELNLNPDLTFIHSPNGLGKSTIAHMVYSILRGDRTYLEDIPFSRMNIAFVDDSTLIVEKSNGKMSVCIQKNRLESPLTDEELDNISDIIYLPPERLMITKKDGHIVNALESAAQELYDSIRTAKDNTKLTPSNQQHKDISNSDLEFWCKDLKAKLDFIKDAGFEPEIPTGYRFPPSRYDLIDDREKYEDLAYSVSDYVEKNYQFAESIIVFKDIINNIFINKTIDVSATGKLVVSMNNGTSLPLNKLSSGETQVLLMFYYILFHSGQDGVVIVDEPEISLHVSWQQMLGDYFSDICRVRKVQIIVATHSPQIIHDKWDLAIEMVRKNA
ncbi:MAG: AAA family ATPase [Candidatus Methanomethylophilaceae archaeon]|nr:AAA family ATPase [Candidatus Methanomethylophilaceae archaeon]MBR6214347.1 AAA family ATPase [Candidatus Methanomethylophilaceae archaeon]